jgi:sporulation protein YlmC with PRC-barrel domain
MPTAGIKYRRLTELIGTTIKNPAGTELGELDNVVFDVQQGKVAYGILSVSSGFLGMNKKLAAIPWSSIEVNERQGVAMLNADKETLQAIAFDENNFPNLADAQYSRDLHQRFNARPYWEALGYVPGEPRARDMMSPRAPSREYTGIPSSEYSKMYNPNEVKTLHGTIESVGTFNMEGAPEGTPVSGVRLRIRTDDGNLVTVYTGPRSYLESRNTWFHHGDEVTVTGSPAKVGWRDVILAAQIKKGDQTLDLRSKEGRPLWNMEESRSANR